jgi:hypothetical protein
VTSPSMNGLVSSSGRGDAVGPCPVDFGLPSVVSGFGGDGRGQIVSPVVSLGGSGTADRGTAAPSSTRVNQLRSTSISCWINPANSHGVVVATSSGGNERKRWVGCHWGLFHGHGHRHHPHAARTAQATRRWVSVGALRLPDEQLSPGRASSSARGFCRGPAHRAR